MIHVQGDIVIGRPVEGVFDFVADERNEPMYNAQMRRVEKLSEGPIGLGTRYQAEVVSGGRPVSMVIEFTEYERPRRLASMTTMSSMDIAYTLTFEPVREGTRMRWAGEIEPRGVLRLMGPLIAWMGRRQELRIWTGLKGLLEGWERTGSARPPSVAASFPAWRTLDSCACACACDSSASPAAGDGDRSRSCEPGQGEAPVPCASCWGGRARGRAGLVARPRQPPGNGHRPRLLRPSARTRSAGGQRPGRGSRTGNPALLVGHHQR